MYLLLLLHTRKNREIHSKAPMGLLNFSCVQIAIALLVFTQTQSSTEASTIPKDTIKSCLANERSVLLTFRKDLSDTSNLLSSWKGDDCCQWKGVKCSNRTGHVVELDLQGPDCENNDVSMQVLGGNISSSLTGLQHLQHLDLSCNRFDKVQIPEFLASLHELKYLDLSQSSFVGRIPPQLGNLSNLRYLSLDSIFGSTYSTDITWLSRLSSLEHLDMSWVNLSTITNWVSVVNMLPSMVNLDLSFCQLRTCPDSLPHSNLTSIEALDISANDFNKNIAPNWFWGLTSLKYLDVSGRNQFHGQFPYEIGNMTSMVRLDLSVNDINGMIPSNLKNLCNLEELMFFENNINGSIAEFFQRLPSCSWNKLKTLFIPFSNLTGSLPAMMDPLSNLTRLVIGDNMLTGHVPIWIGKLTNLAELDLSSNNFDGHVPIWIGKLTNLAELDLSSNNFDGVIHEGHLSGLKSLKRLSMSDNSLAIHVNTSWVPPFNLEEIQLRSCRLGPKFPAWLRWQTNVFNLDISNTSISDMVPDWFWTVASSVNDLNMRNNQISGFLSSKMEFMAASAMDLSSNLFSGPVPKLPANLTELDLSRNKLYGSLPIDFGSPRLEILILYNNSISGTFPSSLCKLRLLQLLDLSNNNLNGPIPDCLDNKSTANTTSLSISNLSLRNNNLSGEFPSFLQICQQLIFLDLSHNHFFGTLPSWITQKLSSLAFLRLRHNMFYGHIPVELANLVNLQYLDLAYNNLSGSIPKSVGHWKAMRQTTGDKDNEFSGILDYGFSFGSNEMVDYTENITVVTKGQERLYTGEVIYMVNLDLSCNNLIGEIPEEIGNLTALINLNLSWNAFIGKIPTKIGALMQVESLDLSHNELSSEIPTTLAALTSLSHLNLSYNNLSGHIPSGNQLQVLDDQASIYIGNPGLCGPPLTNECPETGSIPASPDDQEDGNNNIFLFTAIGSGYVNGIGTLLCIFLFKAKWRIAWFAIHDRLYDWVYEQVAVGWASLKP